ncbi:MAG TPA: hypothetical protein VLA51_01960, partial [Paracoccaceae bacterium]|nr:hypothetical protein [Paracoccaceae bacterium]
MGLKVIIDQVLSHTSDDQRLKCVFNLSPEATTVSGAGQAILSGPAQATNYSKGFPELDTNEFAFLRAVGSDH